MSGSRGGGDAEARFLDLANRLAQECTPDAPASAGSGAPDPKSLPGAPTGSPAYGPGRTPPGTPNAAGAGRRGDAGAGGAAVHRAEVGDLEVVEHEVRGGAADPAQTDPGVAAPGDDLLGVGGGVPCGSERVTGDVLGTTSPSPTVSAPVTQAHWSSTLVW
ncbi:hypothetical protein ACLMNJ_02370 [Streptomyces seoulensis]